MVHIPGGIGVCIGKVLVYWFIGVLVYWYIGILGLQPCHIFESGYACTLYASNVLFLHLP